MSVNIQKAMVMGAGLGTRMKPLTDTMPKPLVPLAGRTLIDHALDRLAEAGVGEAIVNAHYLAEQLAVHVKRRAAKGRAPYITMSDERKKLLDTGGGIKHALPLLGKEPIITFNSDSVWVEDGASALGSLMEAFDPEQMDALLLLTGTQSSIGFVGNGDFEMAGDGRLARRRPDATAPYVFMGVQIIKPMLFADGPKEPFSTNLIWDRLIAEGRLYGHLLQGRWMHVGTPADRDEAEAFLKARG